VEERSSEYIINSTKFRVLYGDITREEAEALVSSDDNLLSMGGGVSMAIASAGGKEIGLHARKLLPLELGDVAVTTAGALRAKYVLHAVTIDYTKMQYPNEASIHAATFRCMELADALRLRTIAFPALGTGVGGFPYQTAAEVMTRTISEYLMRSTHLELVTLTLFARGSVRESNLSDPGKNLFYERAVASASVASQAKRLDFLLGELRRIMEPTNRMDLLSQFDRLESELSSAQRVLTEHSTTIEQIEQKQDKSSISSVSRQIVKMAANAQEAIQQKSHAVVAWGDRQLEQEVARTKLNGMLTQLNVTISQLNHYRIERAKYGGIGVPPILENTISDLEQEVGKLEADTNLARQQLASLLAS